MPNVAIARHVRRAPRAIAALLLSTSAELVITLQVGKAPYDAFRDFAPCRA